ncbi:hypothetical protein [Hyphomicrobium sp.]|uniref:hypothetical protein n=1 Tax=Hyphomicrobium sp. TaxID=82 RepID=UPI000FB5B4AC|nr:hypothetical protein [Hyphomicrobium sp.]RUO99067.1 MAG: hypothetical protein EKK30_07385 [Hyphomicrobium sp.]
MSIHRDLKVETLELEFDPEQTIWRDIDRDRGTALLQILSLEFKNALRAMHRHVILRNALRRPQNLAQILLFVGFGGGSAEILPVDDIVSEVIKEGAAGDGDLHIVCQWHRDRSGRPVFPHQPGRMMEAKRTIKLEDLRRQSSNLIAWVDDCASEADKQGGTWLRRRADDHTALSIERRLA